MVSAFQTRYRTDPAFRARAIERSKIAYENRDPVAHRAYVNRQREKLKLEVLTHYGKRGKLQCCWRGCAVCDIDMLSLDHKDDSGATHRRAEAGNRVHFAGKEIYGWAKRNNYPKGFQTLCMNHQYKKQRTKVRAERRDK